MKISKVDEKQMRLDATLSSFLVFIFVVFFVISLYGLNSKELAGVCLFLSGYFFGQVILLLRLVYKTYSN